MRLFLIFSLIVLLAIGAWYTHMRVQPGFAASSSEAMYAEIQKMGPERALAEFERTLPQVPTYLGRHATEHSFGKALFKSAGIAGLEWCDPLKFRGCFHEMIAKFASERDLSDAESLSKYCGSLSTQYSRDNCFHALGHAFVASESAETSVALTSSLSQCENFMQASSTLFCKQGAFMEYDLNTLRSSGLRPFASENPASLMSPCSDVSGDDRDICANRRPIWWEMSLGTMKVEEKAETMHTACQLFGGISSSGYRACLSGLALSLLRMQASISKAEELCSIISTGDDAELCKSKVREETANYFSARLD